jgi:hypothetical protein
MERLCRVLSLTLAAAAITGAALAAPAKMTTKTRSHPMQVRSMGHSMHQGKTMMHGKKKRKSRMHRTASMKMRGTKASMKKKG